MADTGHPERVEDKKTGDNAAPNTESSTALQHDAYLMAPRVKVQGDRAELLNTKAAAPAPDKTLVGPTDANKSSP